MMEPVNDILTSLEELGQITKDSSIYEIKPFHDWVGTKWKNKIFGMRICNAGEVLDIAKYCDEIPENARDISTVQETLIRSIWSIDGRSLISLEELKKYNDQHKTNLSELQYLRGWIQNLENIVIERLQFVYSGLQLKQVRVLNNNLSCGYCGQVFSEKNFPEDSFVLKYSLAEIICPNCKDKISLQDFNFEENEEEESSNLATKASETNSEAKVDEPDGSFEFSDYNCKCGKELDSLEEFKKHRESCPKAV